MLREEQIWDVIDGVAAPEIIAQHEQLLRTNSARALHRLTAKTLLAKAQTGKGNTRLSAQTRAHLDEIADTLDAALRAQATRVVG